MTPTRREAIESQANHDAAEQDYWKNASGLQEDWERARDAYRLTHQWAIALEESGAGSPEDIQSAWEIVARFERIAASIYASAARAALRR